MQWFGDNLIESILIVGVVLLIIEIVVLGFSTFFLFFAGLAALVTAALMWLTVIPESFLYSLISIAVFTGLFAILLWKPLSKMQKDVDTTRATSDLVGHTFVLPQDIIVNAPIEQKPTYDFSGIRWRLDAHEDLKKGTSVVVEQADVGVLLVKPQVLVL